MHDLKTISRLNTEATEKFGMKQMLAEGKFVAKEFTGITLFRLKPFDTLPEAEAFKDEREKIPSNRVEIYCPAL